MNDAKTWWNRRRRQIIELFDREVYGRVPSTTPNVAWTVTNSERATVGDVNVATRKLAGHVDNHAYPLLNMDIQLEMTTPAKASGLAPVIMEFGNISAPASNSQPLGAKVNLLAAWQQEVIAKGWGNAILSPTSIQAEDGAGLMEGILGRRNKAQPRTPDQ